MIKNQPHVVGDPHVDQIRLGFELRANWLGQFVRSLKKHGIENWEQIARDAVFQYGVETGKAKRAAMSDFSNFQQFSDLFPSKLGASVLEAASYHHQDGSYEVNFDYCALLAAWQKMGFSDEECSLLCDIAMDGDRGQASAFPEYEFELADTLARGGEKCVLKFTLKK